MELGGCGNVLISYHDEVGIYKTVKNCSCSILSYIYFFFNFRNILGTCDSEKTFIGMWTFPSVPLASFFLLSSWKIKDNKFIEKIYLNSLKTYFCMYAFPFLLLFWTYPKGKCLVWFLKLTIFLVIEFNFFFFLVHFSFLELIFKWECFIFTSKCEVIIFAEMLVWIYSF